LRLKKHSIETWNKKTAKFLIEVKKTFHWNLKQKRLNFDLRSKKHFVWLVEPNRILFEFWGLKERFHWNENMVSQENRFLFKFESIFEINKTFRWKSKLTTILFPFEGQKNIPLKFRRKTTEFRLEVKKTFSLKSKIKEPSNYSLRSKKHYYIDLK